MSKKVTEKVIEKILEEENQSEFTKLTYITYILLFTYGLYTGLIINSNLHPEKMIHFIPVTFTLLFILSFLLKRMNQLMESKKIRLM